MNAIDHSPRKAALAFIFVTVLIDMLAFGMIIPVLPMLVQNFVGGNAARAAEIYGVFGTAWALMQFIFSPVQGSLSDHFGRRTVILISCAGLGLDFILMALAPNLWWLLVGRVISGITAASFSTAGAYISDVTPPEKRAASFGLIGAAFGVGFVLGPALGGVLGAISPRLPFWASAFMALANVCWGLFVLPESLPKEKRVPFAWKNANPLGALKLLRSHPMLAGLAGELLPRESRACRAAQHHGAVHALSLWLGYSRRGPAAGRRRRLIAHRTGLPGEARWCNGLKERRAMALGLTFGAAGFAIYGLAPTGPIFWIGVPVMALWGIATPSLQTIMTRLVERHRTGSAARRAGQPDGSCQPHRSHGIHSDFRRLHQHARRLGLCRARLSCWRQRWYSRPCCWRGATLGRSRSPHPYFDRPRSVRAPKQP